MKQSRDMTIQKILISQRPPVNETPYANLKEKFGVDIDFQPFFLIEPLTSREFRTQKINILDYSAIVFSSRHAIDAFFFLCEELRVKVPETMKYFCTTEAVAMYLQKHIVYRKRKIFFGKGTPESVMEQIQPKHRHEKLSGDPIRRRQQLSFDGSDGSRTCGSRLPPSLNPSRRI